MSTRAHSDTEQGMNSRKRLILTELNRMDKVAGKTSFCNLWLGEKIRTRHDQLEVSFYRWLEAVLGSTLVETSVRPCHMRQ